MPRKRGYVIVIHNVREQDAKQIALDYFNKHCKYTLLLMGVEPYHDADGRQLPGHHLHIWPVVFKSQRWREAVIKDMEALSKLIVAPKPEGEEREWGRAHVRFQSGSKDQCLKYLTVPKKDKIVDTDVMIVDKNEMKCRGCGCSFDITRWFMYANFDTFPDGSCVCSKCKCPDFVISHVDKKLLFDVLKV